MISMTSALGVVGLVAAVLMSTYNYYLFKGLPFQTKRKEIEQYFSANYYNARSRFRKAVTDHPAKIELHTLHLDIEEEDEGAKNEDEDFTIDIGLLRRSKSKVIIHISGTHGVEGFAGSAAQLAILDPSPNSKQNNDFILSDDETKPTVIFVHALNPYGFAKLRRFNENNVDLNRNFLTENEFKKATAQDPNHSGYVNYMGLMNPTQSFAERWDSFYLEAATAISIYGSNNLKTALVSGNYRFENTLFYGGEELQQSHVLLKEFLLTQLKMDEVMEIGLIDVHTGLGKSGVDSLAIHTPTTGGADVAKDIFGGRNGEFISKVTAFGVGPTGSKISSSDKAMSGYSKTIGAVPDGLNSQVLKFAAKKYLITQEFGTVPGVAIVKAMRAENTMYQYDRKNRHPKFSEPLRDVFYLKDNPGWKASIVSRGKEVFYQLHSYMN